MKNVKMFLMVVVAVVMMAGMVNVVKGADIIDDPRQLIGVGNDQSIKMNTSVGDDYHGDNLMERVEGIDYVVDKGDGEYYIFLCKFVDENIVFGACLDTDNAYSNSGYPGYAGWCSGLANRNTFLDGDAVDYVLTIYDDDGGRFALLYSNGALVFDDNLVAWESGARYMPSGDMEYNGSADGLLDIVFGPASGIMWLDSIVLLPPIIAMVSPSYDATGIDPNSSLVWEGDAASEFTVHLYDDQGGPIYVFPDLTDTSLDVSSYLDWNTTYNWQVDEVIGGVVTYSSLAWRFTTADYHCQTDYVGDLNGDCIVNLTDFAMMAADWLKESPKVVAGS